MSDGGVAGGEHGHCSTQYRICILCSSALCFDKVGSKQVAFCEGKALIFVLIKSCFPELKNQNSFLIPIIAVPSILHLAHDLTCFCETELHAKCLLISVIKDRN